VEFSYEVSRASPAVKGALLLIDASQGVEGAEPSPTCILPLEHNLTIIPVNQQRSTCLGGTIPMCLEQIDHELGWIPKKPIKVSAKTGENVDALL
jgi:GTP-binding protein LepA